MTSSQLDESKVLAEALLTARYGASAPHLAVVNSVVASQLEHRSIRRFLPDDVHEAQLTAMIAAAQSASTSSNLQVWSVVEVRSTESRTRFAELAHHQHQILSAPVFLVWIADLSRAYAIAGSESGSTEGGEFLETALVSVIDTALAAQNAAVAAESMGLGIGYIGGIRNDPLAVAEILNLPQHSFAVFGMCVGVPDPEQLPQVKPRLPQQVVWHREVYSSADQSADIASFESTMSEFYGTQSLAKSWLQRIRTRMSGPEAMSGRSEMKNWLQKRGFPLR